MLACHAGGRGFESRPLRHFTKSPPLAGFLLPAIQRLLWERTLCATNLRSGAVMARVAHRVRSHKGQFAA
jgi:hypothetical protein